MKSLLLVLAVVLVGCGSETPSAMTEFKKGIEFAEQGDYDTAIACYTKAIRINPNLAVAHFNRGMAYYKGEEYGDAGMAFDNFAKLFPDDTQISDALFWAGESYRQGNQNSLAFRRYNRCRWNFPASKAAKDARHRLTLPEMLEQFEAEANKVDHDIPASKAKAAEFNPFLPGDGLGGTPKGGRGGSSQPAPTTQPQATGTQQPQPTAEKPLTEEESAKVIEAAIRKQLKKPTGELTKVDLEKVTKLELFYSVNASWTKKLTDVKGLEKLPQLTELNLNGNQLTNVKGLEKLMKLKTLRLERNQLTDVKGLEKLDQLTYLNLVGNQLTNVTGLEKLTQLTGLNLSSNQLTNVKGMEKLTQLTSLYLIGNKVTDVKSLEKLTKLKTLRLDRNQLTDVKGLEKLAQLEKLYLQDNPNLTRAQIAELQKALPKCNIYSNAKN